MRVFDVEIGVEADAGRNESMMWWTIFFAQWIVLYGIRGALVIMLMGLPACASRGPKPVEWPSKEVATPHGTLVIQGAGTAQAQQRVMETWRDGPAELYRRFTADDVVARHDPRYRHSYGGRVSYKGRMRHLLYVGPNLESFNHEAEHAACHHDRLYKLGLVPFYVDCATVGHPGGWTLEGVPVG